MTLQDEEVRSRLDLKIFLDVQADERIVRRLKRNLDRGMPFEDIARFYLDSVRHRHHEFVEPSRWHADIVLNGVSFPRVVWSWCWNGYATTRLRSNRERWVTVATMDK